MRKIYLIMLFVVTTLATNAQNVNLPSSDSTARVSAGLLIEKSNLVKSDELPFSITEQTIITNYINTLAPRVKYFNFDGEYLYLDLAVDFRIFDLMEGIKERGISLVYYEGQKMYFVNDNLKIESWDVK